VNDALIRWLMVPDDRVLEDFLHRPAWQQQAACKGVGVDAFVIGKGGRYSRRELCDGCSVRQECLEAALADPELVGLWGGTTEGERREIRRQRVA
jgi:WhiB family redox-sensing transcriptional regulator